MCRSHCIARFRRYKDILQFLDRRRCSVCSGVCFNRSQGLFQLSDATIKPIKCWSSMSCLFWSQNLVLYRSDLSQMKPIASVFLFSHWGSTQSTNKRAKKVACFIFTNTQTYILYKLFGSIFTIKYILRSENPSKRRVYSFLRDLRATWPISKSETPRGFQRTLSKTQYLRRMFYVSFIRFLAVLLVHHVCSLAIYMFLFLYLNSSCVPFI